MESSLQKYDYSLYRKPDIGPRLSYKDYVGKKGEIVWVVKQMVFSFWEIQLETGEKVYADKLKEYDDQIDGLYFVDDYNEAKEKIGKFIWINQNKWKVREQPLITEDRNVSYPLEHLEKIKVVDVFTRMLGHSYRGAPFFSKFRNQPEKLVSSDTSQKIILIMILLILLGIRILWKQ